MTSNELKHQAKVQKWGLAIQDCRSSGLSVREWCRQRGITPTTYYRWEREVLSGIGRKDAEGRSGGTFVELPAPQPLRNNSERTATLNIGSSSITNDLLFEQHISMSDIKATKHIYPDVARLLHKKPETVYKSVIRLAHRCWDALVEQDLVLSYLGRSMKQEPDPSVFITYLAVYIQSDIPFFEFIERDPGFLFRDSPDIFGMSDIPPESTTKLLLRNKPLLVSQAMAFTSPAGLTTFPVCPACMATLEREGQNFCDHCGQRLDWRWYKHAQIIYPGQKSALNILDKDDVLIST